MPASMTRKHFEALAAELRQVKSANAWETWIGCVEATATVCARFNPTFDRARFLTACGVQEN